MLAEKVFHPKLAPDFQIILNATSDLIFAFDRNYQLAYCNDSFRNNFQIFIGEPIDENIPLIDYRGSERFAKQVGRKWFSWLNRAFKGEKFKKTLELSLAGKIIYFNVDFIPVKKNGEVQYIQISAREETIKHSYQNLMDQSQKCEDCKLSMDLEKNSLIRERDEAIDLLMDNAERLQMVFEGSSDGFWDWNIEKDDIFHSRSFYEILGFRNGEIKSNLNAWKERVHPDDVEMVIENLNHHLDGKTDRYICEYRILTKSDEWKWVLDKGRVSIRDENDKPVRIAGTLSDITERKVAEAKLQESEEQFEEITSVLAEGIFLIDSNWKLIFANPEFENLLGYNFEEIANKNIKAVLKNELDDNEECPIEHALKTGETTRISQSYFTRKSGEELPVSFVASPINRNGNIAGCVVAFHDISERMKWEEEISRFVEEIQFNKEMVEENAREFVELNNMLAESEERLKTLNANKDKFFSIISHDLRSPFTSIVGFAEVLLEDFDNLEKDEIKEFTTSIYKTSKNIQNLLENLLQWSRVQSGRIEFNPTQFDVNNLVNDIIALYKVNATRKKIELISNVDGTAKIKADQFMINTVMRNLVSNSIKFTHTGGEISISADQDENGFTFTVADNGVGMPEEIQNKLFKIDEHVTTKGTEKEKGTGLGLILCKEFVEKHEGEIWVESIVGEGSKFKFTIPQN